MKIPLELLLITSSLGAVQSGFFSIYLLSAPKRKELSTRLLGFFLLALAIRMAKSVGYYFSNDNLPAIIENIGYAANLAIAPLLFLYVKSFLSENFAFKNLYWLHLLPAFLVLMFSPFLDDWFWLGPGVGYFLSLYYFGAYFPFIYYLLFKNRHVSKEKFAWLLLLSVGLNLVWAAYAANFLLGLVSYITAPTVFSLVIYPISFFALKRYGLFVKNEKYQNSGLTAEFIEACGEKIENLVQHDKVYLDANLTLPKLAKRLAVSSQTASEVINRHFQMSFADLINSYRLKAARTRLADLKSKDQKIASIAFECDFGTLSAFNTIFKKHAGLTPSEYRRKHLPAR